MGEEDQKAKRKGKRTGCKLRVNRLKSVHDCRLQHRDWGGFGGLVKMSLALSWFSVMVTRLGVHRTSPSPSHQFHPICLGFSLAAPLPRTSLDFPLPQLDCYQKACLRPQGPRDKVHFFFFLIKNKTKHGDSPVVQWLGLCASTAGTQVCSLVRELSSHMP